MPQLRWQLTLRKCVLIQAQHTTSLRSDQTQIFQIDLYLKAYQGSEQPMAIAVRDALREINRPIFAHFQRVFANQLSFQDKQVANANC